MEQMEQKRSISYAVRGINAKGHFTVWEYLNERPVNEYIGFYRGEYLTLYPYRRLVPSEVELKKQKVNIKNTRREF